MATQSTLMWIFVSFGCLLVTVKGQCSLDANRWNCTSHCRYDRYGSCFCDINGWSGDTSNFCQRENVVRNFTAWESSSGSYTEGFKAIDALTSTASISNRTYRPYWIVDFTRGPRLIKWIQIILDTSAGDIFEINITRTSAQGSCTSSLCHRDDFSFTRSQYKWDIDCNRGLLGDRMRVTLAGYSVLTLYEVRVFSCASGTYGEQCDQYCASGCPAQCSPVSGECSSCAAGKYGQRCDKNCSTGCSKTKCKKETGTCTDGCLSGYIGGNCSACSPGRYGFECKQSCSQGCPRGECDHIIGKCSPCKSGYYEDKCFPCPVGNFGQNCIDHCSYCHGLNCDNQGVCKRCSSGRFGYRCNNKCSDNCGADKACHIDTGVCYSCVDRYYGDKCSKKCSYNCENPGTCSKNGTCINGCKNGFVGPMCKDKCNFTNCANCKYSIFGGNAYCVKCTEGWFLKDEQCLKCPMNCTSCDSENYCTACLPGLSGITCSEPCNSQCKNKTCEITGTCHGGCIPGYYTPKCDQRCSDNCTGGYTECSDVGGMCLQGCSNRAYGPDCNSPCERNCDLCESKWQCQQCDVGYYEPYCSKCRRNCLSCSSKDKCTSCIDRKYGEICILPCPTRCRTCVNKTTCLSCDENWTGKTCECNSNCIDSCGVNGKCLNGCKDGLYGTSCDLNCTSSDCRTCDQETGNCTKCITGKYGENCTEVCLSYCQYGECEIEGKCIWGCVEGSYGERCQEDKLSIIATFHLLGLCLGIVTIGLLLLLFI